jgi:small subunit ribosomal protein S3
MIDIKEIKNPNVDAQLVAENIALQIEKRIPHKRAMKKAIQAALDSGARGAKIICGGRLGGAEIARRESYRVGSIPAQTLRADVDYGFTEALTKYGLIGVKVWIYKGDKILDKQAEETPEDKKTTKL